MLLEPATAERFTARVESALARSRRTGQAVLASASQRVDPSVDPAALIFKTRRPQEPWALLEQPDRGGSVVAGLGCAVELAGEGESRFADASGQWRQLASAAMSDEPSGVPGCGPIAIGGFAFSPRTSNTGPWRDFDSASLCVPEIALARQGGEAWLTLTAHVGPDDIGSEKADGILRRLEGVASAAFMEGSPDDVPPTGAARVASAVSPEHYEGAVQRAVEMINDGRVEKVVLAREVLVERDQPVDVFRVLSVLRDVFPSCFIFAVGRGDSTFVGASPELLLRREGTRASTVALAGSAARSADPAVDDHLGEKLLRSAKDRREQAIVTERIERSLSGVSVWVSAQAEPGLAKVANVQHLATPVRAQLREPVAALALAGFLHPTPAVGGEPWREAAPLMTELEGLDRGWYAGPVGWTDAAENGEFCVALRCALVSGKEARCYAGVGVVSESDPASELAETELKLQAILPAVTE